MYNLGVVHWGASKTCNLNCSYCYLNKDMKNNKNNEADILYSFKLFTDKLYNSNTYAHDIQFIGAEPTMVSNTTYHDMMSYYDSVFKDKSTVFRFQTNGQFSLDYFDIFDINKVSVVISIDISEKENDINRGNGTYRKAINNALHLRTKGFTVGIISVLTLPLLKDIDSIKKHVDFCKKHDIKITFKTVHTDNERLSLFCDESYELGKQLVNNNLHVYSQIMRHNMCMNRGNNCNVIEIMYDGNTYNCNKVYDTKRIVGNWKELTIDEILKNRVNFFNNVYINPICNTCKYQYVCNSGCPMDRVNGLSHECYLKKGIYDRILELNPGKQIHELLLNKVLK